MEPEEQMFPGRVERIKSLAANRQLDLTIVLENVHDPHNIGAVLRTCDAVGVTEIYVLYTSDRLSNADLLLGKKSSAGARKWVDVRYFEEVDACFKALRKKYKNIYATHLTEDAKSLHALSLTESTALVFGNEHRGISAEVLEQVDGNFLIPQFGMVESLNISVACAVSLYEACRQRIAKNMYDQELIAKRKELYDNYIQRHLDRHSGEHVIK